MNANLEYALDKLDRFNHKRGMMEPGILYWIVAWTMMGAAFLTAAGSILIGARNLDRQNLEKHHN